MYRLTFILSLLILSTSLSWGQIVSSSCQVDTTIDSLYQEDAKRLALRRMYQLNASVANATFEIDSIQTDTFLQALAAVYNATGLAARDSVVDLFKVHSFPDPEMRFIVCTFDTSYAWTQNWLNGTTATGIAAIDSILIKYNFSIQGPTVPFIQGLYATYFTSNEDYNIQAMSDSLKIIAGISDASPNTTIGGGNDITAAFGIDGIILTYRYGWGDCFVGCINNHYWKFLVDDSCHVTFVESYGDPNPPISFINSIPSIQKMTIFPNPAKNSVTIELPQTTNNNSLQIVDIQGRILKTISLSPQEAGQMYQLDLNAIPTGLYQLIWTDENQQAYSRLLKE